MLSVAIISDNKVLRAKLSTFFVERKIQSKNIFGKKYKKYELELEKIQRKKNRFSGFVF